MYAQNITCSQCKQTNKLADSTPGGALPLICNECREKNKIVRFNKLLKEQTEKTVEERLTELETARLKENFKNNYLNLY